MDLGVEALLYQRQHPRNHFIVPVNFHNAVLYRALLQDGKAKSLSDVSIVLLLQYLDNLIHHSHISSSIGDILNASQRGHKHADERGDGMPQRLVLDVQYLHDEVEAVSLRDLENIPSDQFLDQRLPQLRGDLQRIDPQRQQYLNDALDVLILEVLL